MKLSSERDREEGSVMGRKWTEEEKHRMSETQREVARRERSRPKIKLQPQVGSVNFNVGIRFDLGEIGRLEPSQVSALMKGIAQVLSAQESGRRDDS